MQKSMLDMVMSQIGDVSRYLPKGMALRQCHMHGSYLQHYKQEANCPTCASMLPDGVSGNGTSPTQIEYYIDIRDGINPHKDHDMF